MNVYEPCLFSKFAAREEPAVDGGSIAPGEFVGCALLEVDDHLMGGPGKAHHESMERLRQRIKFGKWHRLLQDGPSFFGGRHFTQLPDRSFKVDMTRFIRERLRPISLPRRRCLDKSAEASDGEVKALRAVAGSLSWIARQCRPDEAGTASTLLGSVSRAVVKDLSDANRAVNQLKANRGRGTSDSCDSVGQPPHSVHFGCRTRLGPSRRFDTGELHGRFHHARAPPAGISSHVTHVLVVAQGETKCVCVSGWRGLHDERRAG